MLGRYSKYEQPERIVQIFQIKLGNLDSSGSLMGDGGEF